MIWKILLTCFFLAGCGGDTYVVHMKERTIERTPAPYSAIQVDRFLWNRSSGKADILLVVDNTSRFEPVLTQLKTQYLNLMKGLNADGLKLIDYRLQIVATPSHRSPENIIARNLDAKLHLAELFDEFVTDKEKVPIFSDTEDRRDRGELDPLSSVALGLAHKEFQGRGRTPLFIQFILGDDAGVSSMQDNMLSTLSQRLEEDRGFYQTYSSLITKGTEIKGDSLRYCQRDFPARATRFFSFLNRFPWKEFQELDLCDPEWSQWDRKLIQSILDRSKRIVLSTEPYLPELMVVRGASRLFQFGQDYQWDAKTMEVAFKEGLSLTEGELIEVSYFVKPNENILSGNPVPPGTPTPPKPITP